MAASFTAKQQNYMSRFSNNVVGLLANIDALGLLFTEASNDSYLTGGANAIPDAVVQTVLPAATAANFNTAMGALANANEILAIVAANRQALELMRP